MGFPKRDGFDLDIFSSRAYNPDYLENMWVMIRVTAVEFQKKIGLYQDAALSQPVTVTRNGRDRTVVISAEEYHRLKRRDREVLGLDDFTAEDLAAIRDAEAPADAAQFDHEAN